METMPTSVKIIGTLIVISGFIAFVGDRVGKRMGKKRLSFLGLRPRWTGVVMSVLTGIFIQLVSITILTWVSVPARKAIFQSDQLRKHLQSLRKQNRELEDHGAGLRKDIQALNAKLASAQTQFASAQEKLSEKTAALRRKHKDVERLEAYQRQLRSRMTHVLARMHSVEMRLSDALQLQRQVQRRYAEVEAKYRKAQKDYAKVQDRYRLAETELNQKIADLNAAKSSLEETQKALASKTAEVQEAERMIARAEGILIRTEQHVTRLQQQVDDYQRQSESLRDQLAGLQRDKQQLDGHIEDLRRERQRLIEAVTPLLGQNVIIEVGEVLHSAVVAGGRPVDAVKADIEKMLNEARNVAAKRGAKGQGNRPPLSIASRYVQLPDGRRIYYYEEHVVASVAEHISRGEGEFIVEVTAFLNCVAGEPVEADLHVFSNRLVFRKGQSLLQKTLDGRKPTGDLFSELLGILEELRGIARAQGMRGGPENRFGEISYQDIFDVLERVRQARAVRTVEVVVAEDCRAIGPLKITLEIRRRKSSSEKP